MAQIPFWTSFMINVGQRFWWGGSPDPRATPWSRCKPGQGAGLRTGAPAPHWFIETVKLV